MQVIHARAGAMLVSLLRLPYMGLQPTLVKDGASGIWRKRQGLREYECTQIRACSKLGTRRIRQTDCPFSRDRTRWVARPECCRKPVLPLASEFQSPVNPPIPTTLDPRL